VTKAEDVLVGVESRIVLARTNLMAADLMLNTEGLASVRVAVSLLEAATKMIRAYRAAEVPLPRRQPRHAIEDYAAYEGCDDCGIPWHRHGEQCGIELGDAYAR
jgi:hypothetical protein